MPPGGQDRACIVSAGRRIPVMYDALNSGCGAEPGQTKRMRCCASHFHTQPGGPVPCDRRGLHQPRLIPGCCLALLNVRAHLAMTPVEARCLGNSRLIVRFCHGDSTRPLRSSAASHWKPPSGAVAGRVLAAPGLLRPWCSAEASLLQDSTSFRSLLSLRPALIWRPVETQTRSALGPGLGP